MPASSKSQTPGEDELVVTSPTLDSRGRDAAGISARAPRGEAAFGDLRDGKGGNSVLPDSLRAASSEGLSPTDPQPGVPLRGELAADAFTSAFHHAAIGMAMVAPQGQFLHVNRALCGLLGYSETELLAITFQEITHPDHLEADLEFLAQLARGEIDSFRLEKRYRHQDGHWVWTLLSVSMVADSQRQLRYYISQIQDISRAKEVEAELFARERDIQTVLGNVPDIIVRFDLNCRVLYVNRAAEIAFGIPLSDFQGKKLGEAGIAHEVCHANCEHIQQVIASGKNFTCGCQYVVNVPQTPQTSTSGEVWAPMARHFQVSLVPEVDGSGQIVSVLSVARDISGFTAAQTQLLEVQRSLQESNEQLALANRELEKLAHLDGLTDLKNRRSFDIRFGEEILRARRTGETFSLAILDIDRFKNFNDTYGHVAGDETLRLVATILEKTLRPIDVIARYGGEEFTVIMPATTLKGSVKAMERCRVAIEGYPWPQGAVTGSFGVATWTGEDAQTLLVRADVALYTAKKGGRNRVEHAGIAGKNDAA